MSLLEVTNLKKIYTTRFGGNKVQALTNVNFSVEKGEICVLFGPSGSVEYYRRNRRGGQRFDRD